MSDLDHDLVDDFRKLRREAAKSLDSLTTLVDEDGDVDVLDA